MKKVFEYGLDSWAWARILVADSFQGQLNFLVPKILDDLKH
jgi:hypothetical protein